MPWKLRQWQVANPGGVFWKLSFSNPAEITKKHWRNLTWSNEANKRSRQMNAPHQHMQGICLVVCDLTHRISLKDFTSVDTITVAKNELTCMTGSRKLKKFTITTESRKSVYQGKTTSKLIQLFADCIETCSRKIRLLTKRLQPLPLTNKHANTERRTWFRVCIRLNTWISMRVKVYGLDTIYLAWVTELTTKWMIHCLTLTQQSAPSSVVPYPNQPRVAV